MDYELTKAIDFHLQVSSDAPEVETRMEFEKLSEETLNCLGFKAGADIFLSTVADEVYKTCKAYREAAGLHPEAPLHVGIWFRTPQQPDELEITFSSDLNLDNPFKLIQGGKNEK